MRHPYCGDRRTEVLKSGNPQSVVAIKRCGNVKSQDIAGQTNTQTITTMKKLKETFLRRSSNKHELPSNPIRCAREYSVLKTACLASCSKPLSIPVE